MRERRSEEGRWAVLGEADIRFQDMDLSAFLGEGTNKLFR